MCGHILLNSHHLGERRTQPLRIQEVAVLEISTVAKVTQYSVLMPKGRSLIQLINTPFKTSCFDLSSKKEENDQ